MSNEHVLVTAIYNYSPYSKMGGRGYDMHFYEAPFLNAVKLGLPLVVYTHENQVNNIHSFFNKVNFDMYEVIVYDLESTNITDQILRLKYSEGIIDEVGLNPSRSPMENQRNHVLCLKKPFFLKNAIENKLFNGKNYYWIDAGLFHHGLFPEDVGGKERYIKIDETKYWPNFKESLFRPGLIESLFKNTNKNFIFISTLSIYKTPWWWEEKYNDIEFKGHVVGGLFGGNPEITLDIYDKFVSITTELLEKNCLILEEEVLSFVYAKYYFDHDSYQFDVWQHDVLSNPCGYDLPQDTRCFYKIFNL